MVSKKALTVINISLGLVAFFLLLNLFEVKLPTVGKTMYWLDDNEPLFVVHNWEDELVQCTDLAKCCFEAKQHASCYKKKSSFGDEMLDWSCQTGSRIEYLLNNKAYSYCQQQNYW